MTTNARRMTHLIGAGGFIDDGINNIPTPPIAVYALSTVLTLRGLRVWEPAVGEGHMARALEACGAKVGGSDLRKGRHIYGEGGRAFESYAKPPYTVDAIITNPPYGASLRPFLVHVCRMSHYAPVFLFMQNACLINQWAKPQVRVYLRALHFLSFSVPYMNKTGVWRTGGFKHMWSKWGPGRGAVSTSFIYRDEVKSCCS